MNWWEIYEQPDATNTEPNCSAAGCPSATLSTGNALPDTITQSICNSQPNRTWENFIKNGKVVIEAKGVTFYHFRITSGGSWQGVQIKDTDSSSSTDLQLGPNRAPWQSTRRLRDVANMILGDEAVLRYSTDLVIERAERAGVWLVIVEGLPCRSRT